MSELSTFRLYLLRATYLLIVVGLGSDVWPAWICLVSKDQLFSGVVIGS